MIGKGVKMDTRQMISQQQALEMAATLPAELNELRSIISEAVQREFSNGNFTQKLRFPLRFRRSEFVSGFCRSKSPTNHVFLSPRHVALGRSTLSKFSSISHCLQRVL
jgi:hypothetical protein